MKLLKQLVLIDAGAAAMLANLSRRIHSKHLGLKLIPHLQNHYNTSKQSIPLCSSLSLEEKENERESLVPAEYWQSKLKSTKWYYKKSSKDELQLPFSCTGCGNCCRTKGEVFLSNAEISAIIGYLNLEVIEFEYLYIQKKVENGALLKNADSSSTSCIFLNEETSQCSIYPVRPFQCATYPFWPRIMENRESWNFEVRTPFPSPNGDKALKEDGNENYWSLEKGGCEGMKMINQDLEEISERNEDDSGFSISEVAGIVEEMRRYEKLHLK